MRAAIAVSDCFRMMASGCNYSAEKLGYFLVIIKQNIRRFRPGSRPAGVQNQGNAVPVASTADKR